MPLRMRDIPSMFAPHLWNVYDVTMNNKANTSNVWEGCNNKFFSLVGHKYSSGWRLHMTNIFICFSFLVKTDFCDFSCECFTGHLVSTMRFTKHHLNGCQIRKAMYVQFKKKTFLSKVYLLPTSASLNIHNIHSFELDESPFFALAPPCLY